MVRKKLKSNSGMSLLMALLLFLVCAVVGAVVLTAATAAAGRAGELAEMDRRYYSVSSAAELLARELSGKSVEVERTKTDTVTETTISTLDSSGNLTDSPTVNTESTTGYTYAVTVKDGAGSAIPADTAVRELLADVAIKYVFGNIDASAYESDTGWGRTPGDFQEVTLPGVTLSASNGDVLPVTLAAKVGRDGSLSFTVACTEDVDTFTMTLTMKPSVSDDSGNPPVNGPNTETTTETENTGSGTERTETKVTTTTTAKTTAISWTVGTVSTGG